MSSTVAHIVLPGETLSSSRHESRLGGKGANQAVAVALAAGGGGIQTGSRARFYGTIGRDGGWIRERMREAGVGVEGILVSEVSCWVFGYWIFDVLTDRYCRCVCGV